MFILLPRYVLLAHGGHLERSHPAGHQLRSWKPQLQTGQRCSHAGLLRGGERLPAQVYTRLVRKCIFDKMHLSEIKFKGSVQPKLKNDLSELIV